jgi:hypothetical protein
LLGIPRFTQEQLSSAYEVMGRKIQNENFPNFKLIQSVYEKRRIILLRLQEIEFYSLRLFEKKGVKSDALVYQIPNILGFMTEEQATMLLLELTEGEAKCTDFRDRVIASYLM